MDMNHLSKLTLLMATFMVISCNEQVSPELKNASSSSSNPTPVTPTEYSFKVTNTSLPMLNYKIHKTGLGNMAADCEVKSNGELSSDKYRTDQANNDITCFFEAEELSMYHSGIAFSYEASPNACAYVAYSPYSYYNRMPGDSSANLVKHSCGAGVFSPDLPAGSPGCNKYQDTDIGPGSSFSVPSDEDLCRFNYKDKGAERCDIGEINITEITYNMSSGPDRIPGNGDDVVAVGNTSTKNVRCGGKISNCIGGAIRYEPKLANMTSGSLITRTEELKTTSKEVYLPGLINDLLPTTRRLANFRRDLASKEIRFGTADGFTNGYRAAFGNPSYSIYTFNPEIMDHFSNNLMHDGVTPLVDGTLHNTWSENANYKARPLAADPYLGLDEDGQTSPFYTFYCLDTAFDIKARIRMVVRDWDRVLPSSLMLERISDVDLKINLGQNPRQDVPGTFEIEGDFDGYNAFNDKKDWDDLVPMERSPGQFDPSTIWRPAPSLIYVDGFFNPTHFPAETNSFTTVSKP